MAREKLTLLFDGSCPLCQREIDFIRSRDKFKSILFVNIDSYNYEPDLFGGITYKEAMRSVHAINSNGEVIKGIKVFQEAYRLIGLGWIYAPIDWPILSVFLGQIYGFWARFRLNLTGRPSLDQLCTVKELNANKKNTL